MRDRRVLIADGWSRVGLALAVRLAADNYVMRTAPDHDGPPDTVARAHGLHAVPLGSTARDESATALAAALERIGGLDVLVNANSGEVMSAPESGQAGAGPASNAASRLEDQFVFTRLVLPCLRDTGAVVFVPPLLAVTPPLTAWGDACAAAKAPVRARISRLRAALGGQVKVFEVRPHRADVAVVAALSRTRLLSAAAAADIVDGLGRG